MKTAKALAAFALALSVAGCAGYSWRPKVPEGARTVSVAAFRNDSSVTELGDVVTRQLLRELQREGTFKLARPGDAAIEIQGVVKDASSHTVSYERRTGARTREHALAVVASVTFIDRRTGKILADGRKYRGETTFLANDDVLTGERDASGRAAEEIARRIADDLLDFQF